MFANVVVDVKSSNVDVVYSYRIPEHLKDYVYIGSRVIVEFGVRRIIGYVIEICENSKFKGEIKEIDEVLDYDKELTEEQVKMALFIAKETRSLLISALELMYPSFLKSKYRKFLTVKNYNQLDADVALLFDSKGKIVIDNEILKNNPKIKKEIDKGNLELSFDVYSYGKRKYAKHYYFNEAYFNVVDKLKGIRYNVIKFIIDNGLSTIEMIRTNINCSNYLIKSLVSDGYLLTKDMVKEEKTENNKTRRILKRPNYNFEQQTLKSKYSSLSGKPFLLFSNSDSFKLDFYLDCTTEMINQGKRVLILTPTLLTNFNTVRYFNKFLEGYDIVNFSSDMSNSEFYDNYMNVKWNNVDIVITTKVGAFLPINNLGLIIVIDEDNNNYIGEYTPKYNTLEVMKFRSDYHTAKLIFSTNCPRIESYYKYYIAQYTLLKYIEEAVNNNVTLVNMKNEIGNSDMLISQVLRRKITECLDKGKQVMLILNSKGYSSYLSCRNCGEVAKCSKCKIPLTYYKEKNEVKCRYCGTKLESMICSKCNVNAFTMLGAGIEKVKEVISNYYPNSSIMLMDSDSLKDVEDYQDAIIKIETQETNIVIGTNNIANLYNANFELIALISVDDLLNSSDYKASENVYNLIASIVNRKNTEIVIQGYNIDNYVITSSINNDYITFYEEEIKNRSSYGYPPFLEINKIIISGEYKEMYHCANYFKKMFNTLYGSIGVVLGPTYVHIKKGVQLIVKHNNIDNITRLIDEVEKKFTPLKITISFERYPKYFG